MANRIKKVEAVKVGETSDGVEVYTDKRAALKLLIMRKAHSIFDREPAPAYNSNVDKLVDEIIEIFE